MRDDQPNEAQILAQIDKVAQARAELEKANARFLLAIRGKLTPEQWKQMQELPRRPRARRPRLETGAAAGTRDGQRALAGNIRRQVPSAGAARAAAQGRLRESSWTKPGAPGAGAEQ